MTTSVFYGFNRKEIRMSSCKQLRLYLTILVLVAGLLLFIVFFNRLFDSWALKNRLPAGDPLVIVWELAGPDNDYTLIGDLGPVQVVSPVWFHLVDSQDTVRSDLDPLYLQWARERGYQVWALVTNSFDPDLTAELLSDDQKRQFFAREIVSLAIEYNLEGLNIDFENFHYDYRDHFTSFIAELAELCRAENLILSVDVAMPSGSEYWSMGYDRAALATEADYIILMAYDEHWASSPVAGSVASLPWVEAGLQQLLNEVPPAKLILGVPFYTRLWVIDETGVEPQVVNTWSYSMTRAAEIAAENEAEITFDVQAGQHVATYEKEGLTYKMWLEDTESMCSRLELVEKYNLAGLAGWRRGLETPEIWELMDNYLGH
jgi:spore germination protein YaaH